MKSIDWLKRACAELGVRLDTIVSIQFEDGERIVVEARLPDIGGPNGMLLFRSDAVPMKYKDEIQAMGCGFAVLSEPLEGETFDLASYREMFVDWGWQAW